MATVQACDIPSSSALWAVQRQGAFADCYTTVVKGSVSQAEFVEAFYTSRAFKVERTLLAWFAGRPATDKDAARLANGTATSFSAWTVEFSSEDQLLLADVTGRTRSWLRALQLRNSQNEEISELYFGSAVLPKRSLSAGAPRMGLVFHELSGFHTLYSKLLLRAARSKLQSDQIKRFG